MPKKLNEIIDIQNEIVRVKEDIKSVDGDELRSLEERLRLYLKLQGTGGRALTKRDENGNILLYEDPLLPGNQLQKTTQYISVELIKPDYDNDQSEEVLDTEINELFTPQVGELDRLRQQIEDLRQQLANATSSIVIESGSGTGGNGGNGGTGGTGSIPPVNVDPPVNGFPSNVYTFPDNGSGSFSENNLQLSVNTAIFNDTTYKLENFGGANPISIKWWIIDRNTEEIYDSGIDNTSANFLSEVPFGEGNFDVVIELSNLNNFEGWFVTDDTYRSSIFPNYYKFSEEPLIRFNFNRRKVTENDILNLARNVYYIIVSYLNVVPSQLPGFKINIDAGKISLPNHEVLTSIGFNTVTPIIGEEYDGNIKINVVTNSVPFSINIIDGNELKVFCEGAFFTGWYVETNGVYRRVTGNRTYRFLPTDDTNIAAGFIDV